MENGKFTPKTEVKAMSRRNFLAGAGAAGIVVGLGDMLIVTGPLERKEREVAKQFPNLNDRAIKQAREKIEAENKAAQKENRQPDKNQTRYSAGIVQDAKKRDEKLAEIRTIPSGVRRLLDYGVIITGAAALLPKGLRYYYENSKRDF